jgi:hypothetical protein
MALVNIGGQDGLLSDVHLLRDERGINEDVCARWGRSAAEAIMETLDRAKTPLLNSFRIDKDFPLSRPGTGALEVSGLERER